MSLPEFKFTNLTKPTNDTSVNSGLSAKYKMVKSGIIPDMVEKAQDTASSLKTRMSDISSSVSSMSSIADNVDSGSSFFSFTFLIKAILIAVIAWFMWVNLANNGDFHLGMGDLGSKLTTFFNKMEENGRELIAKISGSPAPSHSGSGSGSGSASSSSESDADSDAGDGGRKPNPAAAAAAAHQAPVPPPMNNSSDKKPGFNNEDPKYTFLDKASREYSGPSPRPDDSTSTTQKHQSGKAGYCYIGEDRGFRSCARVEAGDKCMSGQIYSRQDRCIDPTLRD